MPPPDKNLNAIANAWKTETQIANAISDADGDGRPYTQMSP